MNRKRTKRDTAMDTREKDISRGREQTSLLLTGQRTGLVLVLGKWAKTCF